MYIITSNIELFIGGKCRILNNNIPVIKQLYLGIFTKWIHKRISQISHQ